jgi:hypothetical protein
LATKKISSWEYERLVTRKAIGIVVVHNLKVISALTKILVDDTVKLSEVWKTSSSHPNNEMF